MASRRRHRVGGFRSAPGRGGCPGVFRGIRKGRMQPAPTARECSQMREARRLLAAVAMAVLAAACSSGSGKSAQTPKPTVPPKSTTTLDPTTAAILSAYRANWAEIEAVGSTFPINPQDPRLSLHATGVELQAEQNSLAKVHQAGHFERGPLDLNPEVTSLTGDMATVMDCDFDHSVEIDAVTMKPVDQPDLGHTLVRFTMAQI